jgi:general stress protein 26
MTLDDVKALMKEVGWGTLATSDGQCVGCRPMGGWAWFGDELWCASGAASDKVRQLQTVPHAEYCFARPDGLHVRIAGPCTISTDNTIKKQLHDAVPLLKKYIPDPASPDYVVLVMRPDQIRVMAGDDLEYQDVGLA